MNSPWGEVQQKKQFYAACLTGGATVLWVDTAGHGGFMLDDKAMALLNPALRHASVYGGRLDGYTCFEEDCEAVAVLYELQELGVSLPAIGFREVTKEDVTRCLGYFNNYQSYLKERGLNA